MSGRYPCRRPRASLASALVLALAVCSAQAGEVRITVKGVSWDSDSGGFAAIGGLSRQEGTRKAVRRGSRVSVDGRPDVFAVSGDDGGFELTLTTSEPTLRLVIEGDRFPPTITQPYLVPDGGGELDAGRVSAPRAEGAEHSWPLPMAAAALGYGSAREMLADDKAAIRLLIRGSGTDGAPRFTNDARITFPESEATARDPEPTTTSSFLRRVPRSEYLIPFWMTPQATFFELEGSTHGAYLVIVSFDEGEGPDKAVTVQIEDTVTNDLLVPPRPWPFGASRVLVRNGFATDVTLGPDIDLDN